MARRIFTAEMIINNLRKAKVLCKQWDEQYNRFRPHSLPGYKPPAPAAYGWEPMAPMQIVIQNLDENLGQISCLPISLGFPGYYLHI